MTLADRDRSLVSADPTVHAAIGRELITTFFAHLAEGKLEVVHRGEADRGRAAAEFGFAIHAHHLGRMALDLLDREHVLMTTPTVRACFEHALTAHWIAQSTPDAALAVFNHELKQRRAMAKTLQDATIPEFQQAAVKIGNLGDPLVLTGSDGQAKVFASMLDDFQGGGPDIYAYYRLLCAFTHPRMSVADAYLCADPGPTAGGYGLQLEPQAWDRLPWVHIVASCLVWAGSAVRYLQKDKIVRRQHLRDAAKALGTEPEIHLTAAALSRQPSQRRTRTVT
ncbi:hypothetical protein [Nocardia sp. NPDC059239]|uniref:hypothetical protein n=1 Tax=Nocardia sp. NPDC059239 TaxID=3346785 RepID=UPI00369750CC